MPRRLLVLPCALVALVLALWAVLPVGSLAITNQQKLGELQQQDRGDAGQDRPQEGHRARAQPGHRALDQPDPQARERTSARCRAARARSSPISTAPRAELDRTRADLRFQRARAGPAEGPARRGPQAARRAPRRALPGGHARPRLRDPELERLRRAARARRVPAGASTTRTSGSSALVASARIDARDNAEQLGTLAKRQATLTARIAARRNAVASVKQELIDTRVGFDRTRQGKANALSNVRADRHKLEGSLSAMKATQAKIQGILTSPGTGSLPAGPIRGGSGAMIWPVNGPITSPFCERRAWEACHPGIDIGVPVRHADPRRARRPRRARGADRAATATTRASSTARRCPRATPTSRAIGVSVGQQVSQGQVIGYVGCTGLCFGDAPALRGAHQRRGHEPAELPVGRTPRPDAQLLRAAGDRPPRPAAQDVRHHVRARLHRRGRGHPPPDEGAAGPGRLGLRDDLRRAARRARRVAAVLDHREPRPRRRRRRPHRRHGAGLVRRRHRRRAVRRRCGRAGAAGWTRRCSTSPPCRWRSATRSAGSAASSPATATTASRGTVRGRWATRTGRSRPIPA